MENNPELYSSGRLFSCNGLVAVITGGGSGLGKVMALALVKNGATVFVLGRRLDKLQEVAQEAQEGKVIPVQCDVSSKEALEAAAKQIEKETGYVNLLCVNHGISGPIHRDLVVEEGSPKPTIQDVQQSLWKVPMEDFTAPYNVNVTSVHYTAVAFLSLLDAGNRKKNVSQSSQVVITGSIGSFHRNMLVAGIPYVTSKAAVTHLGKVLAAYLIQFKIRVNVIAPGLFHSDMTAGLFTGDPRREGSVPATMQPMLRTAREEEIAGTILYLASEAGAYCSGSVQVVDGGRLGVLPGATY